jgi:hypothetical protein
VPWFEVLVSPFIEVTMILPTARRLPIATITFLLVAIGCSDERQTKLTAPANLGPSFNESGDERPTPPTWDGEHESHFSTQQAIDALARAGFADAITGITEVGGHFQAAVLSQIHPSFPVEGATYLSFSSGDARTLGLGLSNGLPCVDGVAVYGRLCNVGGLDVAVQVPASATSISFALRYWSTDYCAFLDPFRVFLVPAGGSPIQVAVADLQTELNCPPPGGFRWSPQLRLVTVNVAAYAGQSIVLRFRASDRSDTALPSGAIVDDLHFDVPLDNTPPVIVPVIAGTAGANGWYVSDVNVTWTVTDGESAVVSQIGCGPVSVTEDTPGVTFTCSATSAGGTASQSVTIMRDATAPVVAYAGNAGAYTVDQSVSISCSAADAMSGLASNGCANIAGDAYTFDLGTNTFSANATDVAGNVGSATTSFTVSVTFASLCTLSERFSSKPGVATSLCAKLNAAENANTEEARKGQINAYLNEVEAQIDKALTVDHAAILDRLGRAL